MLWRGIGACAAIATLGAVAGHVATGSGDPPATRAIHLGAATLTVPAGWHVVSGPGTTLSNGRARMRVAFGGPADRSLVPPALRSRTRGEAPTPARLGGYRAWAYGGVTVLPSARGVLGVACNSPACARIVGSVSIAGAAVLEPTPDLALRLRAPALLAALDATRVTARAQLAAVSSTPRVAAAAAVAPDVRKAADAQLVDAAPARVPAPGPGSASAIARRLAAAHAAALDGLRPVAGPVLVGALSRGERAYGRLAAASSAAEYDAARDEVFAADRAVDLAVADLARAGAPDVQRPPAVTGTPRGGVPVLALLLVLAAGLLATAVAPAGLRRLRASSRLEPTRRRDRRLSQPGVVKVDARGGDERERAIGDAPASRCLLIRRGRTPIAPPPTYGRWNEAPRGPSAGVTVGDARDSAMASSSTT